MSLKLSIYFEWLAWSRMVYVQSIARRNKRTYFLTQQRFPDGKWTWARGRMKLDGKPS